MITLNFPFFILIQTAFWPFCCVSFWEVKRFPFWCRIPWMNVIAVPRENWAVIPERSIVVLNLMTFDSSKVAHFDSSLCACACLSEDEVLRSQGDELLRWKNFMDGLGMAATRCKHRKSVELIGDSVYLWVDLFLFEVTALTLTSFLLNFNV